MTAPDPDFTPTAIYFLGRADALIRQATASVGIDAGNAPYLFRAAEQYGELARVAAKYPDSVI